MVLKSRRLRRDPPQVSDNHATEKYAAWLPLTLCGSQVGEERCDFRAGILIDAVLSRTTKRGLSC
jgi:hypothetical protein